MSVCASAKLCSADNRFRPVRVDAVRVNTLQDAAVDWLTLQTLAAALCSLPGNCAEQCRTMKECYWQGLAAQLLA